MRDAVLVLNADLGYLPFARRLFANALEAGRWQGDLLLITADERVQPFSVGPHEVRVKHVAPLETDPGWSVYSPAVLNKFSLFQEDLKQWRQIVYLDCDITIQGDIRELARAPGFSAAPYPSYFLNQCFRNKDSDTYRELAAAYDLECTPFNSGVMAFPSSIITPGTYGEIVALFAKYRPVAWGDDEIINLYFYKRWRRLKITYNFDKEHGRRYLSPRRPPRIVHHIHEKEWQTVADHGYGSATAAQDRLYELVGLWLHLKLLIKRTAAYRLYAQIVFFFEKLAIRALLGFLSLCAFRASDMAGAVRRTCAAVLRYGTVRLREHFFIALLPKLQAWGAAGVCTLPSGIAMHCHGSDIIQRYLMAFGIWEPNITRVFTGALAPGDVAIDIGANIGYYTLLSAQLVGPAGKVFAIEASPSTYQALKSNIARNNFTNVEARHIAVDDGSRASINIYCGDEDNSGIATVLAGEGRQIEAEVACSSVDRLIPGELIGRIRLVKIDVEGFEVPVVQGMRRLLAGAGPRLQVLVEIAPERMRQAGYDAEDIFKLFGSYGFSAYTIDNPYLDMHYIRMKPEPPQLLQGPLAEQTDVLFTREPL